MKRGLKGSSLLAAGIAAAALAGCDQGGETTARTDGAPAPESTAGTAFQDRLIEQLIDAQAGDVIELPEGVYEFERSLTLTTDGVTIRGAGHDKTVLSFKNQIAGAEGLLVTASDITLEGFAIEDTIGDALKVNEGDNIVIRGVRTEWTNGPDTSNGAYGIYPVQTTNTLVEDCIAIAAADAGIYVGQSRNVVVRYNRAEYNVAGIEIENTVGADVYGNIAINNTGGILVFNMPHLPMEGHSTRIFQNEVRANNTKNFGAEGTAVASVPAGSGILIQANDRVEIFDNDIADNKTANVIVSSYFSSGYTEQFETAEGFDPYPESILITGNRFDGGGGAPDLLELQALRVAMFGPLGRIPDVLWDGYFNPALVDAGGELPAEKRICVPDMEVGVLNVDGPGGNASPSKDAASHRCELERLAPVELASAS